MMLISAILSINILILGHSFASDCTQNLPAIALEAGMKDVRVGRFVKANCSLEEHWNYFQADSSCFYSECAPGSKKFVRQEKSVRQVLEETEWDYIVFQNSLENEGRYETVQPFLDNLIEEFDIIAGENEHKKPVYCWNMFWPISKLLEDGSNSRATYRLSFYDNSSEKAFEAYKKTAARVVAETAVSRVIPVGLAIMDARASTYNTPEEKEFTRDGYHLSYAKGRWIAASCWYQYFLAPVSGIDVCNLTLGESLPDALKQIASKAAAVDVSQL